MNTLKKMLVTVTMVVTLGATTSCGNKDNQPNFVGGLPYTVFFLSDLDYDKEYKVQFECEGDPEVYWNSETSNHEKSHVFEAEFNSKSSRPIVLIKGNIDNLRFCDTNGSLLADGNSKISTIIFSNTITKISDYACYSLQLPGVNNKNGRIVKNVVYLPASIKTIGKNAFFPSRPSTFVCEPTSRPSGWDINWCTVAEYNRFMSWGFSYYITDNYDVYYIVNDNPILTAGYVGNLLGDVTNLEIPETINVNNYVCPVVSIASVGDSKRTLESVTLPKTVVDIGSEAFFECRNLKEIKFAKKQEYLWIGDSAFQFCSSLTNVVLPENLNSLSIDNSAFWSCGNLKDINFAKEYEYVWIGRNAFEYCSSLTSVTLPKGLTVLSNNTFEGCTNLAYIKIPNTVKTVGFFIFDGVQGDNTKKFTIDLTGYTASDQIATCDNDLLSYCEAENVTFKIKSPLTEKDFTDKGWPKADGSGTPKVVWDTDATLNA